MFNRNFGVFKVSSPLHDPISQDLVHEVYQAHGKQCKSLISKNYILINS